MAHPMTTIPITETMASTGVPNRLVRSQTMTPEAACGGRRDGITSALHEREARVDHVEHEREGEADEQVRDDDHDGHRDGGTGLVGDDDADREELGVGGEGRQR